MITLILGCRCRAIAIGAEREPGDTHAYSTPCAASSSTKVAANDCVTSIRSAGDSRGCRREIELFREWRRHAGHVAPWIHAERAQLARVDFQNAQRLPVD